MSYDDALNRFQRIISPQDADRNIRGGIAALTSEDPNTPEELVDAPFGTIGFTPDGAAWTKSAAGWFPLSGVLQNGTMTVGFGDLADDESLAWPAPTDCQIVSVRSVGTGANTQGEFDISGGNGQLWGNLVLNGAGVSLSDATDVGNTNRAIDAGENLTVKYTQNSGVDPSPIIWVTLAIGSVITPE